MQINPLSFGNANPKREVSYEQSNTRREHLLSAKERELKQAEEIAKKYAVKEPEVKEEEKLKLPENAMSVEALQNCSEGMKRKASHISLPVLWNTLHIRLILMNWQSGPK